MTVALRLEVTAASIKPLKRCMANWFTDKEAAGVDPARDRFSPPHIEVAGPSSVDVVLDGTAESGNWEDWLVDLSRELSSIGDVQVTGFKDRVSGSFRPHLD